jgi:hypothetical protein
MPEGGAEAGALAAALAHLLVRDEERPAIWHAATFSDAVEAARAGLATGAAMPAGPSEAVAADPPGFREAVDRLARDPAAVAGAIRRIEATRRGPLPAWVHLVRHGLPALPSDLDRSIWFG